MCGVHAVELALEAKFVPWSLWGAQMAELFTGLSNRVWIPIAHGRPGRKLDKSHDCELFLESECSGRSSCFVTVFKFLNKREDRPER
jgi:hypothetical protein